MVSPRRRRPPPPTVSHLNASPAPHPPPFPAVPADRQRLWLEVMSLVCAVAVDVGLGIALGALLLHHADGIAEEAGQLCLWLQVDVLKQAIEGLKHAPYGIKLNPLITHKVAAAVDMNTPRSLSLSLTTLSLSLRALSLSVPCLDCTRWATCSSS